MKPDPLILPWRGRQLRVRHDDPNLTTYSGAGQQLRAAVGLASDVGGLRLVLVSALGDRYRVRVSDDGSVVGLWRRCHARLDDRPVTASCLRHGWP